MISPKRHNPSPGNSLKALLRKEKCGKKDEGRRRRGEKDEKRRRRSRKRRSRKGMMNILFAIAPNPISWTGQACSRQVTCLRQRSQDAPLHAERAPVLHGGARRSLCTLGCARLAASDPRPPPPQARTRLRRGRSPRGRYGAVPSYAKCPGAGGSGGGARRSLHAQSSHVPPRMPARAPAGLVSDRGARKREGRPLQESSNLGARKREGRS